ncbi:DNA repair protein RecO [Liberiplasma polymorphum]|uniref:DNA repair protein RecO n=1 Tax=Liberiplasma polymorphum TaxID=3374570 RepID=UPI003776A345
MENVTLAYILKTVDYQEYSKLVYFYTDTGLHSALARGIKKFTSPFRHLIQPGNIVKLTLTKGKLPTLKDAEKTVYYPKIKEDLVKSTITSVINELIYYNLSKDDNHQKLFPFILKTIPIINESESPLEILMIFEMKMLHFLGYGIDFNQCHVCQSKENLFFNSHTSMVTCHAHTTNSDHHLNENDFMPLKYFLHVDISQHKKLELSIEETLQYMKIIDSLYTHHLGNTLKSKQILYTLL